jgi:hypothetical protein
LLLSLDNNRQPEVWSRLINRLANGEGRLVRIKLPKTKVPTVPNLVLPWATAYQEFGALLEDPAVKLIQIGLSLTSQRPAKRGFEAYRQRDLGHLVQQQM